MAYQRAPRHSTSDGGAWTTARWRADCASAMPRCGGGVRTSGCRRGKCLHGCGWFEPGMCTANGSAVQSGRRRGSDGGDSATTRPCRTRACSKRWSVTHGQTRGHSSAWRGCSKSNRRSSGGQSSGSSGSRRRRRIARSPAPLLRLWASAASTSAASARVMTSTTRQARRRARGGSEGVAAKFRRLALAMVALWLIKRHRRWVLSPAAPALRAAGTVPMRPPRPAATPRSRVEPRSYVNRAARTQPT